jgi:hypothetical protein
MSDIESKAKELGWAPKEEFRGDPEKWIDAETYVRRGEELMPLLKANNKRMSEELHTVKEQLKQNEELLKASQESIEALKEFNAGLAKKEAKEKAKELKEALVEAKREGDVEREVELTEQLREQREVVKAAEKEPEKKPNGTMPLPKLEPDATQNPEWKAWIAENDWFGKDRRRTALAIGVAEELKNNPETATLAGKALLDRVSEEVDIVFNGAPRTMPSKVEGGGRGVSGGVGKSFLNLPAEAKAACDRQAERLVGPGRAFKSMQDWRNHYTAQYFAEE